MTFPTHLFAGLAIGAATGDYSVAVVASVAPDVDHVISYARHGVFRSWDTFWGTITAENDPWNDQRNMLHNIIVAGLIVGLCYFFFPEHVLAFAPGYGVHLFLDASDAADFFPFYPLTFVNFRGPIHYNSLYEYILAILFLGLFLLFLIF